MRAFRSRWLAVAFALVALAFLASSFVAQWTAGRVTARARSLQVAALPGIEQLSAARAALLQLASLASRTNIQPSALAAPMRDLDLHLDRYLELESYPGERELFETAVRPAVAELEQAIRQLPEGRPPTAAAAPPAVNDVRRSIETTDEALQELMLYGSAQARTLTSEILATRGRALRLAAVLDTGSAALAALAAGLAIWQVHRHTLALQARADELDSFASRVAHDLMSPLAAVQLAIAAIERLHPDDQTRRHVGRATRALDRSRLVVGSIYEFARSGGIVPAGAHAPVGPALRAAADALLASDVVSPPEVTIEPCPACEVACDPGVLAIMVSNLLTNAAKFTAGSPVRRIWMRSVPSGDRVRIEVEDTGLGVPPDLEEAIFEPHVRAPGVTQPGLGLGLATVKRYAIACGGAVGVRRAQQGGSVFWFELPRVTAPLLAGAAGQPERAGDGGRRPPGKEAPA